MAGRAINVDAINHLPGTFWDLVDRDRSLGPLVLEMKADGEDYLFQQGVNVAITTMTGLSFLSFDPYQVLTVAIGPCFTMSVC